MARAIVLRVEGTNCDGETAEAFRMAGAEAELVHVNEIKSGKKRLEDYQMMAIPGGFSYGDDIAAGILLGNQLKFVIRDQMKAFVDAGKPVIGICNGFQALVRAGILPYFGQQAATLANNDCGSFQDRWVHLKHANRGKCLFTRGIKEIIYLPIAHGEGKFVANDVQKLFENDQVVFRYCDKDGNPSNPNGSISEIAGICNPEGNVFGLMPHPERFVHPYTHPFWTMEHPAEGDGLAVFMNAVDYAEKKFGRK